MITGKNMEDMTFEITGPNDPDYQFTEDWFSRHKQLWDSLMEMAQPRKVLEIGSFEGRCTTYLIEKIGKVAPGEVFCVDMWNDKILEHSDLQIQAMEDVKARFDHNIRVAQDLVPHPVNVLTFACDSVTGCSQIAAQGIRDFDLVYIDGSHIASTVFYDAAIAFQLCRPGGLIIFDDYREDKYLPYIYPKMAIDAWYRVHENKVKHCDFFNDGEPIPVDKLYQRYFWKLKS